MRTLQYLGVLLFLFVSCTGNTIYDKPKDLIPKDTMLSLLTEMHIASSSRFMKNKNQKKDENYIFLLYEKYNIDSARFHNSNVYYTSKIDEYSLLLKEVKARLEQKGVVIQKQILEIDSLAGNIKPLEMEEKMLEPLPDESEGIKLSREDIESIKKAKNERKKKLMPSKKLKDK